MQVPVLLSGGEILITGIVPKLIIQVACLAVVDLAVREILVGIETTLLLMVEGGVAAGHWVEIWMALDLVLPRTEVKQ